jgi:serine/threonine protein kinase
VVKVGIDRKTKEKVAVKLVNKSLVEKEETLANEISILGSMDHPNVVNMRAIFDTDDILFIVMELYSSSFLLLVVIGASPPHVLIFRVPYFPSCNICNLGWKEENSMRKL